LDLQEFVSLYEQRIGGKVTREGANVRMDCPLHGGHSFVAGEKNGNLVFRCWACEEGNTKEGKTEILRMMGLTWADVMGDSPAPAAVQLPPEPDSPISFESLSAKVAIPMTKLQEWGVVPYGKHVRIRYHNPDGSPAPRSKVRTKLTGKNRFYWDGDRDDPQIPYVLDYDVEGRDVFIVEGESDVWTFAYYDIPAIGIPGAEHVKLLTKEHVQGARRVFVVQEADQGGTLFVKNLEKHMKGWGVPTFVVHPVEGCKDTNDMHKTGDFFYWYNQLSEEEPLPGVVREKVFDIRPIGAYLDLPPLTFLVEGVIVEQSLVMVYAPPESFKSFITLDMAGCVAAGIDLWGRKVKQAGVLYVAGEGSLGMVKRARAWAKEREVDLSAIPLYLLPQGVSLSDKQILADLIEEIPPGVKMIVIDTLHSSLEGDENSARDVKALIDGARALQKKFGVTVVFVHHAGKEGNKERGSSALRGAMDTMLLVTRETGNMATLKCTKQKDFARFDDIYLTGKVVELEDGETSLTFNTGGSKIKHLLDELGETKKAIVRYLMDLREKDPNREGWASPSEIMEALKLRRDNWGKHRAWLIDAGLIVKHPAETKYRYNILYHV
jgi:hypothetical protein